MTELVQITTNCSTTKDPKCLLSSEILSEDVITRNVDFDDIDAEKCVQFSRCTNPNEASSLTLTATASLKITYLKIVSENKHFEVFSSNQFLSTATGDLFDDFEGIKIYTYCIPVRPGCLSLTLQMPGNWETCWVYSIHSFISENSAAPSLGHFDLSTVDQLLNDRQQPLSKKAQSFKMMFDNFQRNPQGFPGIPPPPFSGIPTSPVVPSNFLAVSSENVSATNNSSFSQQIGPPKFADLLANPALINSLSMGVQASMSHEPLKEITKNPEEKVVDSKNVNQTASTEAGVQLSEEIRTYIDAKFSELERTLLARLDAAEQHTATKLDHILLKLNNEK